MEIIIKNRRQRVQEVKRKSESYRMKAKDSDNVNETHACMKVMSMQV